MAREPELYKAAQGSPLEGYFLLKAEGKNMPPAFSERAAQSKRSRHEHVAEVSHGGDWGGITTLRDRKQAYPKECFYRGIRILLELERSGESDL